MNHQSVPKHSGINFYNNFGGGARDFVTKNNYPILPHSSSYGVDGRGRDQYIKNNNGGLALSYQPALAPHHGNFFMFKGQEEKALCHIPSKNVGYNCNGTGRDLYISRTNGGFYPDQPVAAYQ